VTLLEKHLEDLFGGVADDEGHGESKAEEPSPEMDGGGSEAPSQYSHRGPDTPVSISPRSNNPSSPVLKPADSSDGDPGDAKSPSRLGPGMAKLQQRARMAGKFALMRLRADEQHEVEAKLKRYRLDAIQNMLSSETLKPELCSKELNTTWVSPAMKSLILDASDRQVLRKTAAESYDLKMASNLNLSRPLSQPALTRRHRKIEVRGKEAAGDPKERKMSTTMDSLPSPMGGTGSTVFGHTRASMGSTSYRVQGESLVLEPPQSLSTKVANARLESEVKAFRQQSFAIYMKEYDVFTGALKQRFDEKRLRDEEVSYLTKMDQLVGGGPMRLLLPAGMKVEKMLPRSQSSPGGFRSNSGGF